MGVWLKGAYILIVHVGKDSEIEIGSLGKTFFEKGDYAYIGSAMNSLEKRIKRHKGKEKKLFWHIDYLLSAPNSELKKVFVKPSNKKEECRIAEKVSTTGIPVRGFGCSDCDCSSHLFRVKERQLQAKLKVLGHEELRKWWK